MADDSLEKAHQRRKNFNQRFKVKNAADIEKVRQRQREASKRWRERHPEKSAEVNRENQKRRRIRDPQKVIAYGRSSYAKNKEIILERLRVANQKLRFTVLSAYSPGPVIKCACCGESEYEFLTLDHINNDGSIERAALGGSVGVFKYLIKANFPGGYQVLCWNCNAVRRFGRICPHQREKL
jgi:hypothetical protein